MYFNREQTDSEIINVLELEKPVVNNFIMIMYITIYALLFIYTHKKLKMVFGSFLQGRFDPLP